MLCLTLSRRGAVDALAALTWDEPITRESPAADVFAETLRPMNTGQKGQGSKPDAHFRLRKAYLPRNGKIFKKEGSLPLCRVTDGLCGRYTLTVF